MQTHLSYRARTIDGPADDLLTLAEAAKYLRVGVKTLRRMVDDGHFPPPIVLPRGGSWWHWLDIVAFLHMQGRGKPVGKAHGSASDDDPSE